MIHLEHVALPDGLRALAYRDAHGLSLIHISNAKSGGKGDDDEWWTE